MNKFKVILEGFETAEQALAFANWWEGSGEQYCEIDDETSILTDMDALSAQSGFSVNERNEVIIPIRSTFFSEI